VFPAVRVALPSSGVMRPYYIRFTIRWVVMNIGSGIDMAAYGQWQRDASM